MATVAEYRLAHKRGPKPPSPVTTQTQYRFLRRNTYLYFGDLDAMLDELEKQRKATIVGISEDFGAKWRRFGVYGGIEDRTLLLTQRRHRAASGAA